jgi:hypothetical protein
MINWSIPLGWESALPGITAFLWAVCVGASILVVLSVALFVMEVRRALRETVGLQPGSEFMGFSSTAAVRPADRIWESHESPRDPLHNSLDGVGGDSAVARA